MAATSGTDDVSGSEGSPGSLDELIPLVYGELRQLAHSYVRRERYPHSLDKHAVVHEVYLRLARSAHLDVQRRPQFLALAAQVMRRILVDQARQRRAGRRGGGTASVPLLETAVADLRGPHPVEVLALDQAFLRLKALAPQQFRVVGLRYFAGLTIEETAKALGVSSATVKREWIVAKAWLARELGGRERSSPNGNGR
jgi:RNA polymerase sigma factor (TIGR02999 family)